MTLSDAPRNFLRDPRTFGTVYYEIDPRHMRERSPARLMSVRIRMQAEVAHAINSEIFSRDLDYRTVADEAKMRPARLDSVLTGTCWIDDREVSELSRVLGMDNLGLGPSAANSETKTKTPQGQ